MNILALDTGTFTGWCYRDASGHIESGTQDFSLQRGESPGMRFLHFNRWLRANWCGPLYPNPEAPHRNPAPQNLVNLVLYEQTHHRGGAATHVGENLVGRVLEWCAAEGIEHKPCHTSTLKKAVTGNGHASKEEMARAVAVRMPELDTYREWTEHECDALCLLAWFDLGMPESARKQRVKREAKQ